MRPEHVGLSKPKAAAKGIAAKVTNVVYFGTDTHYHLTLSNGAAFTVRLQNPPGQGAAFAQGDDVEVGLDAKAIQVLQD